MTPETLDTDSIEHAAGIIRLGGVVAFPTETVYGLGADAFNPIAVAKIFQLKERPSFDPLIVHIASLDDLERLTAHPDEKILMLAEHFWPGPLTIVFPKNNDVPDIVTSGLPTVGIRMPDNRIALELIRRSGCAVAAPSANKFGHLSPTSALHVKKQLPDVDFVLDGGKTNVGIESTIISVEGDLITLLRPGKITIEEIAAALPGVFRFNTKKSTRILASGMLKSHYSPRKPLYILEDPFAQLPENSGLIIHQNTEESTSPVTRIIKTSENGNLLEVASHLFSALHVMEDDASISQIFIRPVPEEGLGAAIMDRIRKAAYQYRKYKY